MLFIDIIGSKLLPLCICAGHSEGSNDSKRFSSCALKSVIISDPSGVNDGGKTLSSVLFHCPTTTGSAMPTQHDLSLTVLGKGTTSAASITLHGLHLPQQQRRTERVGLSLDNT